MMHSLAMEPPARYTAASLPDGAITERIHLVRGHKVMLDQDLAELYGVRTKALKQAVRRNMERFPADFMFELTLEEGKTLRSQIVTLKQGKHIKYAPFAFTEHGILMLANVLRSEQALAVSIHIIRVFTRMREVLLTHQDILLKLEELERKVGGQEADIQTIFHYLKQLLSPPPAEPRRRVGYKTNGN